MHNFELKNMTVNELRERSKEIPAILLPVASIEILGNHGPLGLDLTVAQTVTPVIAEKSGCLAAPVIPYGDTMEFSDMDGTVHIPPSVLEDYCYAVARSLFDRFHAKAVVFLNVHSLNGNATSAVCRRLCNEGLRAATVDWWATLGCEAKDILTDYENGRGHGGEMITSVAMAIMGSLVQVEKATHEKPLPKLEQVTRWTSTPFKTFGNFSQYCKSGAWGDVSKASVEKGKKLIDKGINAVTQFLIKEFQN